MGDITLYNGDCLEIMKGISDGSVDLVVTDPPYLFSKGGMSSKNLNVGTKSRENYINTDMSDFGEDEINKFLNALKPKFRNGWNAYFFCSEMQVAYYLKYAVENKIRYNLLVWDRQLSNMISYKFFRSHIDYIIRLYKGNGLNKIECDNPNYLYGKIKTSKKPKSSHPTVKPVEVIRDFILLSSNEGDVVLDSFMGSGTTGVACADLNRKFIGIELDENYFSIAKQRIQAEQSQLTLF